MLYRCSLRLFLSTAAFRRAVKLLLLILLLVTILLSFNRQCSLILNSIIVVVTTEFHLSWSFSIAAIIGLLLVPPSFLLFLVSAFHLVIRLFRLLSDLLYLFAFDFLLSLGGVTLFLLLLLIVLRCLTLSLLLCLSILFRRQLMMATFSCFIFALSFRLSFAST